MADGGGRPTVLGEEVDHFWLVQRMAKATGTDLVAAWEAGVIDSHDWAGIVTRCRGCTWTDGCGRFLDEPVEETRDNPEPCLNRARMDRIRAALESGA